MTLPGRCPYGTLHRCRHGPPRSMPHATARRTSPTPGRKAYSATKLTWERLGGRKLGRRRVGAPRRRWPPISMPIPKRHQYGLSPECANQRRFTFPQVNAVLYSIGIGQGWYIQRISMPIRKRHRHESLPTTHPGAKPAKASPQVVAVFAYGCQFRKSIAASSHQPSAATHLDALPKKGRSRVNGPVLQKLFCPQAIAPATLVPAGCRIRRPSRPLPSTKPTQKGRSR